MMDKLENYVNCLTCIHRKLVSFYCPWGRIQINFGYGVFIIDGYDACILDISPVINSAPDASIWNFLSPQNALLIKNHNKNMQTFALCKHSP